VGSDWRRQSVTAIGQRECGCGGHVVVVCTYASCSRLGRGRVSLLLRLHDIVDKKSVTHLTRYIVALGNYFSCQLTSYLFRLYSW
jgi:hypothetical protein